MIGLKKLLLGGAVAAALTVPLVTPAPAQAWWSHGGYGWHGGWHGGWGWGWHGGWGWRGGVYIGGPAVVVGPPAVYAATPYRFIPGHYTPYGAWVPPHWGYY
jgi:hypothetical protein